MATLVLVVEDFEQFRRFICSTLAKKPDLQIVGEASDGLAAVRKAESHDPSPAPIAPLRQADLPASGCGHRA
jgi:chemotaxis response regulator CheB